MVNINILNIVLLKIQYERLKLETSLHDLLVKDNGNQNKSAHEVDKILERLCVLDLKQHKIVNITNEINKPTEKTPDGDNQ